MSDENQQYLDYLDKEMSIMGILSTFCVGVPALVLERLASADKGDLAVIWCKGRNYFWIASALMLVSAALFYKQRSLLAFYYGRIALGVPPPAEARNCKTWKQLADSRTTYIPYNAAFWVGMGALMEYLFALISYQQPSVAENVCSYGLPPLLVLVIGLTIMAIVHKDRPILFSENFWKAGIDELLKKEKR